MLAGRERRLNSYHMRCFRNILEIEWQDRIPDTEVLSTAVIQSLYPVLRSFRLWWLGHVARMDNSRIPKQILHGKLSEGTHNVGRPKLRLEDQCKTSVMEFSINVANWDMVAQDRVGWRAAVLMGAKSYEEIRVQSAVENRQTEMPHSG